MRWIHSPRYFSIFRRLPWFAIELPVYSYVEHTRMQETVRVEPKKVIILEGILLLTDARLREEMNLFLSIRWISASMRRIKRDVNERGRSRIR